MYAAKHRLRKETDINKVLRSKKGVFDSACGIKYAPNGLDHGRFAVVVGTKVSKNAVDRNRLRRQYQEIIRLHPEILDLPYDILCMVQKPALTLDYDAKQQRFLAVLAKARLSAKA
ncbi:ribonuclease P protein component [Patescibacteria group bacterium]|jgi:ribonuclease P protein component|nr:ribonuclease P protein component [Patescibacteria group bacterium]